MLVSEEKPIEEVLESVKEDKSIFLIGCGGCSEALGNSDLEKLRELRGKLEEAGKQVTGTIKIDFLCNKALVGHRLLRHIAEIDDADSLLVSSCGIGVQAVAATVDKMTRPALNTVSVSRYQGVWPSEERCRQCGECLLEYTGGICPLTACAKQLLNGPCGGSNEGMCEVEPDRECGWYNIYERLRKLGRLDLLYRYVEPKKFGKEFQPPTWMRTTVMWALENPDETEPAETAVCEGG